MKIISRDTVVPSTREFPRHSEATIVETEPGKLLLAWSRFTGARKTGSRSDHILESDNDGSDIAGLWSDDRGLSWRGEHTLIANDAGLNVMSPALAVLGDRSIGLIYSHRDSEESACRIFCRSTDGGATWSGHVRLTSHGYITGTHDRLTVLSDGRIIAPLHFTDSWYARTRKTMIAWSDDNGTTWAFSPPVEVPTVTEAIESGGWEPGVTELADGRLLLVVRTALGTLYRAESRDRGESWADVRPMEVTSPIAPGIVTRVPDRKDLILVWNWHYDCTEEMFGQRKRLSLAISHDDGESWPMEERMVLEDDPDWRFSYPSCTFIGQTGLVTYYAAATHSQFGARSLKLARLEVGT